MVRIIQTKKALIQGGAFSEIKTNKPVSSLAETPKKRIEDPSPQPISHKSTKERLKRFVNLRL